MSLLMEALRKAEDQKRRLDPPERDTRSELALEPLPTMAPQDVASPVAVSEAGDAGAAAGAREGRRLPELPTRMEELDEQFLAHAAEARGRGPTGLKPSARASRPPPTPPASSPLPSPTPSPAARKTADAQQAARAAAQAMFAAGPQQSGSRRPLTFAVLGLGGIGAVLIGGYFWWQLQATARPTFVAHPASAAPSPAAAPAPPTASAVAPAGSAAAVAATPGMEKEHESAAEASPPSPPRPLPRQNERPSAGPRVSEAGTPSTMPATAPPATTAPPAPATTVQISAGQPRTDRAHRAHMAFERGELDEAQATWLELLREDARRLDALHGLAAIALRQGRPEAAAGYYQRALEAEPRDALALAGLLSLRGTSDARSSESSLKNRIAEQPDSPYLHFALGNLLAREGRWAEAQQAFFNAHVTAPDNPDILFNLAVSLDQLRQIALAARYYRLALAAAARAPAGFNITEVETRLRQLAPD